MRGNSFVNLSPSGGSGGRGADTELPRELYLWFHLLQSKAKPMHSVIYVSSQDLNGQKELCPRLCHLKKGPNGYGFNLHSEKSRPGQFIRSVDPDSPASRAGLRPQDRLVEVMWRWLGTSLPKEASEVFLAHATQVQSCSAWQSSQALSWSRGMVEAVGSLGSLELR